MIGFLLGLYAVLYALRRLFSSLIGMWWRALPWFIVGTLMGLVIGYTIQGFPG